MSNKTVQSTRNAVENLLHSSVEYIQQLSLPGHSGALYDSDLRVVCIMPEDLSKLSLETQRLAKEYSLLVTKLSLQRAKLAVASVGTEEHAVTSRNVLQVKRDIAQNDADTAKLIVHRNRLASTW